MLRLLRIVCERLARHTHRQTTLHATSVPIRRAGYMVLNSCAVPQFPKTTQIG